MTTRTFTQFLLDVSRSNELPDDFTPILSAMSVLSKLMAALLSRGSLALKKTPKDAPLSKTEVHEEIQQLVTESLLGETASIQQLAAISIAGNPNVFQVSDTGRFLLLTESLEDMENLTDNLTVGVAFSVLARESTVGPAIEQDFLQPGSQQVCAGIVLFGLRTLLLVTTGKGVSSFTLDRDIGSYVRTEQTLQIPQDVHSLTVDASQAPHWSKPVKRFVDECIQGTSGPRGHDYTMRWNASPLVGAFRVLNGGGLFLAPDTGRDSDLLPLLHNAAPLAFLAEQAGGRSSTGTQRMLEVVPESLNSKTSYFMGSEAEVDRIELCFSEHEQGLDTESTYPLFGNRSLFAD